MRRLTIVDDLKPIYAVALDLRTEEKVRLSTREEIMIYRRKKVFYETFKTAERARECAKNILRENKECKRAFVYEVDLANCEPYGYEE